MDFTHLSSWSTEHVLRLRRIARQTLEDTPHHLYPLSHEYLLQELRVLNEELGRRAAANVVYLDELEYVGDAGTLEDALQRLVEQQRD